MIQGLMIHPGEGVEVREGNTVAFSSKGTVVWAPSPARCDCS